MKPCCKKEIEKILPVYTIIVGTMKALIQNYEEFERMLNLELYDDKETK